MQIARQLRILQLFVKRTKPTVISGLVGTYRKHCCILQNIAAKQHRAWRLEGVQVIILFFVGIMFATRAMGDILKSPHT